VDFSAYKDFQKTFVSRYGAFERTHPFTMMVLEQELRNSQFGDTDIAQRNLSRQSDRLWIVEHLLKLGARRAARGPQVYIEMPGFAGLAADLSHRFEARNVSVFSNQRIMAQPANKLLHRLIKLGPTYSRAMARAGANGPDALLEDTALLARLEAELAVNYERMKNFVRAQNIRAFIATGDCKPFSRFLCRAAQDLDLPYIVLAHGYISHSTLVSIAPVHADRLIVWTEQQAKLLHDAVPDRAEHIYSFGFPPRAAPTDRTLKERRVLFVWEPLGRFGILENHLPVLSKLAATCSSVGFIPAMRLHPKERGDEALMQSLRAIGFEIDSDDMGMALSRAAVVASSNSTVLCEAAACGIPAVQIEDLAVFAFEGAEMCAAAEFDPARAAATETGQPALPLMDTGRFFDHIAELMT